MRRAIVNIALILLCFTMQYCIFPFIPFLSTTPNLLLILVFSYGFIYGSKEGMIYGLIAGVFMDLFYSGPVGFYTLIYVWIGYINGLFSDYYYEDYITLPLFLCTANELAYNLFIYIFRYFFRGKTDLLYYAIHIVIPEMIITILVTLVFYRLFLMYNKKLESIDEKRSKESA